MQPHAQNTRCPVLDVKKVNNDAVYGGRLDNRVVRSIDGIEDALAYLENWPESDRGPRYFVAINALETGSINPDEAKPY